MRNGTREQESQRVQVLERDEKAQRMLDRLDELEAAKSDAITDTRALTMVPLPEERQEEGVPWTDRLVLQARTNSGELVMRVLENAHRQMASKVGIPWKYYERMLKAGHEDLAARNVNRWLRAEPENRLLRLLAPMSDAENQAVAAQGVHPLQVRAVLSDRYRPLDHEPLVRQVLPILAEHEAEVTDWNLGPDYFHFRFATEEQEILQQFVEDQPRLQGVEEVVSFGGAIRNSETGHGALHVSPAAHIKRCTNVLVMTDKLRKVHLGGRTEAEEGFLQADTRRLDDAATFLKVRDKVVEVFSAETTRKVAQAIAEAASEDLALPPETPVMEFVGNVGKRFDLTEHEVEVLRDEFTNEVQETGRRTRWSLSQAMTAAARRMEEAEDESENGAGVDYERRQALEETGWKVLESPMEKLLQGASR